MSALQSHCKCAFRHGGAPPILSPPHTHAHVHTYTLTLQVRIAVTPLIETPTTFDVGYVLHYRNPLQYTVHCVADTPPPPPSVIWHTTNSNYVSDITMVWMATVCRPERGMVLCTALQWGWNRHP